MNHSTYLHTLWQSVQIMNAKPLEGAIVKTTLTARIGILALREFGWKRDRAGRPNERSAIEQIPHEFPKSWRSFNFFIRKPLRNLFYYWWAGRFFARFATTNTLRFTSGAGECHAFVATIFPFAFLILASCELRRSSVTGYFYYRLFITAPSG